MPAMYRKPRFRSAWVLFGPVLLLAGCESPTGPNDGRVLDLSHIPLAVAGGLTFSAISVGGNHTCALAEGGQAYCWGSNYGGALGDGTGSFSSSRSAIPVRVAGELSFSSLSSHDEGTCGLTRTGALYCWGGSASLCPEFCNVAPTLMADAPAFISIGAASSGLCGLTEQGAAHCTSRLGSHAFVRVLTSAPPLAAVSFGQGSTSDSAHFPGVCGIGIDGVTYCGIDERVPGDHLFSSVSAGYGYACGITAGTVHCWGSNSVGELGRGYWSEWDPQSGSPAPVVGPTQFSAVASGYNHSCALTPAGTAYCWGEASGGKLGHQLVEPCVRVHHWYSNSYTTWECYPRPHKVSTELTFGAIDVLSHHTCALTLEGKAYCWGANTYGQLGTGK